MTSKKRPESLTRINTRLETFLAKQLGYENVEFYEQEGCVEDNKNKLFFKKFSFRLLIVCNDRIYITDNPPKNLDNFICFDDIIDINTVDDIPKFLSGAEQENALHINIKYYDNPKRKKELEEIKKKVIEFKKEIVYSKSISDKIVEIELNTPRTFRSDYSFQFLNSNLTNGSLNNDTLNKSDDNCQYTFRSEFLTNRSDLMTNRTVKSVRFDDEIKSNKSENKTDTSLDYLTNKAVNERYKHLIELVNKAKNNNLSQDLSVFSLSLPLTPRSIDGESLADKTIDSSRSFMTTISKQMSKSLEDVYDKINSDFIKDNLEKKFKQLKNEIIANIDDLETTWNLYDELLKATHDYSFLKKIFWNASDLYKVTVNQINRYLPKSPANMKMNKVSATRRIKELDCSIAFVETLSIMFHETEFLGNRNEILNEEKCKYLNKLINSLICDPELAVLNDDDFYDEKFEIKSKMNNLVLDLTLVSTILMWEMLHFTSSNSWNCLDFSLEIMIKEIENSKFLEIFVQRLIGELSKLLNDNTSIILSAQETVIIYKLFSFLQIIVEKSSIKKLRNLLIQNYQEEFKYYFNEDRIRLKSFNYYPIVGDLLTTIKKLKKTIL